MHRRAPASKRYCRNCGYDLQGLEEQRCPECGRRFDARNPRSFRATPPLPLWIRRARNIAVLLTVAVGLAYVIFRAARSYECVRVIEVSTHDARVRERTYYILFGFSVWQAPRAPVATELTPFLHTHAETQGGQWVRAGSEVYDWRGRRVDSYLSHGIGQLLVGAPFKAENLTRVDAFVPDLAAIIRRDILAKKHHGVSSMLMITLRDMCADPTEGNVKRLLDEWKWRKEHPDLFGGG